MSQILIASLIVVLFLAGCFSEMIRIKYEKWKTKHNFVPGTEHFKEQLVIVPTNDPKVSLKGFVVKTMLPSVHSLKQETIFDVRFIAEVRRNKDGGYYHTRSDYELGVHRYQSEVSFAGVRLSHSFNFS